MGKRRKKDEEEKQNLPHGFCFECLILQRIQKITFTRPRTRGFGFCDCESSIAFMRHGLLFALSINPDFFSSHIFNKCVRDIINGAIRNLFISSESEEQRDTRVGKQTLESLEYVSRIARILTNHFSKHHFQQYQLIINEIGEISHDNQENALIKINIDQNCKFCSAPATYQNLLSIADSKKPMYRYNDR